jgi:outer membrane protein OmpA-like peptidoglycan-associated protein
MGFSNRLFLLLPAVLAGLAGGPSPAQPACGPDAPGGLPCVQEPWQTVGLEHRDRVARLHRLADRRVGFEFFEETITPQVHGIAAFPTEIPILRIVARQDVFFDSGRDVIRPEAQPLLDLIAESLKREPPDVALFVAGHTDADGSDAYNMQLGLARADRVASALVRRGVYQAAIYRVSFGEHVPIASNESRAGKAKNRRVEFLFAARTEAVTQYLVKQKVDFCPEHRRDPLGSCKVRVVTEATKISVSMQDASEISRLDGEVKSLSLRTDLDGQEIVTRRQEIELKRERIPVTLSTEKIIVELH